MEDLPGSSVRCGQGSFKLRDWIDELSPDFAYVLDLPASGQCNQRFQAVWHKTDEAD